MGPRNFCLRAILIALTFVFGAAMGVVTASGEEIAVAFTGQACAALYPCLCPGNPEGGVARRATAIKKLRQLYPKLLVVEAGKSFASGADDPAAQNAPLDMQRTEIYLNALRRMDMDALLVSSQEYAFGKDFLNRFKDLPFVSSNAEGAGVPFIIKKLGSVSVGILGLTDVLARSRGASSWRVPQQVLGEQVRALRKKGVQCIVALSALSPEEDAALLQDVSDIDVVINGASFYGSVVSKKTGKGTEWVQTWWQAKKILILILDVSGRNVGAKKLEAFSLGPELGDDPDVKAALPACFQNGDCKKMPGMASHCQNNGTLQAQCSYTELYPIPVTVVVPRSCRTCRIEEVLGDLERLFEKMKPAMLLEDSPQAQELIKTLKIKMLPAYIVGADIEKQEFFPAVSAMMEKRADHYVFKPQVAGVSYFVDRPVILKRWDVFFDFTYPALGDLCDRLLEFQRLFPDVDVKIHFLAAWDPEGGFQLRPGSATGDLDELKRAACVNALIPGSLLRYIGCRSVKKDPGLWESCAAASGIDVAQIKSCAGSSQADAFLKKQIELTRELEVAVGPTFIIDNKEVFGIAGVPAIEELERIMLRKDQQKKDKRGHDENNKEK